MSALEHKIPPPIVAVVFAAVMWMISFSGPVVDLSANVRGIMIAIFLVSGAIFSVTGILTFRRAATTFNPLRPETASSLVNSGIYQVSRNPMYVGLVLFLLAWGVYLSSAWVFVGVPGFVLYMNRFQIIPEESALMKIFGSRFESYKSKVRRWL